MKKYLASLFLALFVFSACGGNSDAKVSAKILQNQLMVSKVSDEKFHLQFPVKITWNLNNTLVRVISLEKITFLFEGSSQEIALIQSKTLPSDKEELIFNINQDVIISPENQNKKTDFILYYKFDSELKKVHGSVEFN